MPWMTKPEQSWPDSRNRKETDMEPIDYTVVRLDGDYALLVSDQGVENLVARALLPMEIEEGSRLHWEMFTYTLI